MKRTIVLVALAMLAAVPVLAQAPAGGQPPAGPVSLSEAVKQAYNNVKRNVTEAAEKMPEADYSAKIAGPAPEGRTFGQWVGHLINSNFSQCAQVKGEKNPHEGHNFEQTTAKADLVKAVKDAFAYCDPVYNAATDAMMTEMSSPPRPRAKGAILYGNVSHTNEGYGSMAVLMRLKNQLPPSTERQQQMRRPSQ